MKKFLFIAAALFAAILTSCQREPITQNEPQPAAVDASDFPEIIYASAGEEETKAGMDRYDAGGSYKYRHHWDAGDVIHVFHGTVQTEYTCTNPATGEFTKGTAKATPYNRSFTNYCAVYSSISDHYELSLPDNNQVKVMLEAYISSSSNPGYANFMTAVSNDGTHFRMESQLGWIKLQVKGKGTVKEIRLYGNYEDDISQYLTYNFATETLSQEGYQEEAMTATLATPVELNPYVATVFYFTVPAQTFASVGFEFLDASQKAIGYVGTNKSVPVCVNTVTPMAVKTLDYTSTAATLADGKTFNAALKTLAAGSSETHESIDNLIKGIKYAYSTATEGVNVSSSTYPVYAVFDSATGIVTLNSTADRIYLNKDSRYMFANMKELESIELLSQIQESQLGNSYTPDLYGISFMFRDCAKLTTVDLSKFNTTLVSTLEGVFNGCSSLSSIDLTPLSTTNVKTMKDTFRGCSALTCLDVSSFDTSSCSSYSYTFANCTSLESIHFGDAFLRYYSISNFNGTFYNCSKLEQIHLTRGMSTLLSNQGGAMDGSNSGGNIGFVCQNCTQLKSFILDISGNCNAMSYAFEGCNNIEHIDIHGLNDNTTTHRFISAFRNCFKLKYLDIRSHNFSYFPFSGGAIEPEVYYMFDFTCRDAERLDLYMLNEASYDRIKYLFNSTMKLPNFITTHFSN